MKRITSIVIAMLLLATTLPLNASASAGTEIISGAIPVMPGCDIFRHNDELANGIDWGLAHENSWARLGYNLLYCLLWPGAKLVQLARGSLFDHACPRCQSDLPPVTLQSENLLRGARVTDSSGCNAGQLLRDNRKCWTPKSENAFVEIQLAQMSTFNTAIIKEWDNRVQYFRLQAWVDGEWRTVYQSEKIQRLRLCGFDAVTTDRVRLCIDKLRDDQPAQIQSLRLYNEPAQEAGDFEVVAYKDLREDVPSEILAKGEDYAKNYARFYDVYTTVIVIGSVGWGPNGVMHYYPFGAQGLAGEADFARELAALRELIGLRSNKEHKVKLLVNTLSQDSSFNNYMAANWEAVADASVTLLEKYDLDGIDIDWEYPVDYDNLSDDTRWRIYDKFAARLDEGLQSAKPGAILSGAMSSGWLGMAPETLARFDQIQFMAYDHRDMDGYHSSLEQAQANLNNFIRAGARLDQINIGIGAYGRPVDGSGYFPFWRDQPGANYWDCKYYGFDYKGKVLDYTYCSPAVAGDKTAYALFSGAGGVMVWYNDSDRTMDDPVGVTGGIANALGRYAAVW